MRKYACIKKYMGNSLEKEGFQYDGFESGGIWSFSRKKNDITQRIRICQERFFGGGAELVLETDAYGRRPEPLTYAYYKNEEEFIEAVKHFNEKIMDEGLDKLEQMSMPTTEKRPTVEMERYLFENHEVLCEEYEEKFHLSDLSSENIILEIINFCKLHKEDDFFELKRDFLGLAAVYGKIYERTLNGKWVWYEEKRCMVMAKDWPVIALEYVIHTWRGGDYTTILTNYKYICDALKR